MRVKWFFTLFVIPLIIGCSGIHNVTSTIPSSTSVENLSAGVQNEVQSLFGIFQAHVDISNNTAEMTPLRNTSLTDVLETVDITNFLTLSPCSDCAKIKSLGLDSDSNLVLEIGIRHPFPPGDPYKPITGRNRADLHVFNVEGIVVSSVSGTTFSGLDETVSGIKMLNPDGYTKYLDAVLDDIFPTDATIHPYITHFDDYSIGNFNPTYPMGFLSVVDPPPSGNLVMPMGSSYDYKNYVFDIDGGVLEFIFVVGCTYPIAAENLSQRFQPEYRIPQHNKKAASEVSIEIVENDLYAFDPQSKAVIIVRVVDVSHGVEVGSELDKMAYDSSVDEIIINARELMSDLIHIDGAFPESGSGHNPSDPLAYRFTLPNQLGADIGVYDVLVKVTDSYPVGMNKLSILEQKDGIKRVSPYENPITGLFEIQEFATYQVFSIEVVQYVEIPIWPVLQGNIAHTGYVGLNGPLNTHDDYTWQGIYPPGWNYYGNPLPMFLSKDTAFLSNTGDGGPLPCLAIDLTTHEIKWTQQFHDDMQNWLNLKCINKDGTVVLTHETGYNRFVGLDASDGSYMWEVEGSTRSDSHPTMDLDGNFIIPVKDVGFKSVEPLTGTVNWTATVGDPYYCSPATGENGVIYATVGSASAGNLYALDPSNGATKWISQSIGLLRGNATVVHPNQTILCHGGDGLFCFRDLGSSSEKVWSQQYACPFYASVGVAPNGDIYLLDWDGNLRRINKDTGETIQSNPDWGDIGLSGNFVRMAIGEDGLLYFGYYEYMANEAWFTCANPDCTLKWRHYGGEWFMGDGLYAAPAIGQDGTVYSSYRPDGLVAWKD